MIDYGLLMTSLYPIATYKFTGAPLVIGGVNLSSEGFQTGGRALLFPEFLKFEWLGPLAAVVEDHDRARLLVAPRALLPTGLFPRRASSMASSIVSAHPAV